MYHPMVLQTADGKYVIMIKTGLVISGGYWRKWSLSDIRIYGNSGSSKSVSDVFRTTAMNWTQANMGNIQFWQVSKIIYESWADAVEWALTNQEYDELGAIYSSSVVNNLNKQS